MHINDVFIWEIILFSYGFNVVTTLIPRTRGPTLIPRTRGPTLIPRTRGPHVGVNLF